MSKKFRLLLFSIIIIFGFLFYRGVSATTISPVTLEESLAPGQTGNYSMALYNETDSDLHLEGKIELFKPKGDDGQAELIDSSQSQTLSWLKLPVSSIVLKPGEYKNVHVLISVPKNAQISGYYYAIMWKSNSVASAGGQVGIASQVGCLLLLDVQGEKQEKLQITDFKLNGNGKIFGDLPISLVSRLRNDGNTHLKPQGSIILENFLGQAIDTIPFNPKKFNILPQSERKFDTTWLAKKKLFVLGPVSAKLSIEYGSSRARVESSKIYFWVIPWKVTSAVVVAVLILIILIYFIKRKK